MSKRSEEFNKMILDSEVRECLTREIEYTEELEKQVEQLRVQLAGCSVAALGGLNNPAKEGDYGWNPSYQDVLSLRKQYELLLNK
jgi:hypothetical protein